MNMILCGYKACGKSTIAKAYSKLFSAEYIDTDDLIIKQFQSQYGKLCRIGEIYTALGELPFRQFEARIIQHMPKPHNAIIATGVAL